MAWKWQWTIELSVWLRYDSFAMLGVSLGMSLGVCHLAAGARYQIVYIYIYIFFFFFDIFLYLQFIYFIGILHFDYLKGFYISLVFLSIGS